MTPFYNRESELQELNNLLAQPKAQMLMMFGRRRIGKTTLLIEWAKKSGLPYFYWVAKRDPKELLQSHLARAIYAWERGLETTNITIQPQDWEQVFRMLATAIGDQRVIIILDELPYALQQDASFGTYLQAAWDHLFKATQAIICLSGSHIGMLTDLTTYHAPLYGRLTAQFPLYPLSFPDIIGFLPHYDVWQRLGVYAMLGGVPAYLERWRDEETLANNVERLFLQRTGWFRNETQVIISDLTQRETAKYEAILETIAAGHHRRDAIASYSAMPSTSLSHYLPRLLEMHFVTRRVPATVPLKQLKTSKQARYHLRDPFLRFYYRFIAPNLHLIERGLSNVLWQMIEDNLRAFVALMFEEVCREWVIEKAQQNQLPFVPDNVGSHWSKQVQVDVVAINWRQRQLLLGECKWGDRPLPRSVVMELVSGKTPKLLAELPDNGKGWQVQYAFFARRAFTEPAQQLAIEHNAQLWTLPHLY